MYTILVVDDSEKLCKIIKKDIEILGHKVTYAISGHAALTMIRQTHVDAVLLDLKLGNEDGIEVLERMRKIAPDLPVIMITGNATIGSAVLAIKKGAFDYIQKPVNFERLVRVIKNAVGMRNLARDNTALRTLLEQDRHEIVPTANPEMLGLLETVRRFAETNLSILITGESGTGKELVAEYIHAHSHRREKELSTINCAAFSETLLDDELFGHTKGAFTGAVSSMKGVFERSHGSTLFLDEIGDMPLAIQAKILRAIQSQEIRRLGDERKIVVDTRFIAATNKNIQELVARGGFREDLYFRLNTCQVLVPPLRDRPEDIGYLGRLFLERRAALDGSAPKRLAKAVEIFFNEYDWPGNVRELRNVIDYGAVVATGPVMGMDDLPEHLFGSARTRVTSALRHELSEKERIEEVLVRCRHNKSRAADMLKISRRTLYNKLEKWGIDA